MADEIVSDSDGEEFVGFTLEECAEAEEKDVRKQLQIANFDSHISLSRFIGRGIGK
jgi:hypothetical protein